MPEISRHQKQYLLQYKKEKRLIFTARILLFVLFMGLWEMSARCGWIDSFIFSSPSLIGKTFLSMCRDQSLFSHIGVTLTETLVSFFFVVILGVGTAILLWELDCDELQGIYYSRPVPWEEFCTDFMGK